MVITGLVVTGSALAGYWGVANYRRTPKHTRLIECIAPAKPQNSLPNHTDNFGEVGKRLVQKLVPSRLFPAAVQSEAQLLLEQLDDRYQLLIHNTIDPLFGSHYEKHLRALAGTTETDIIPPMVRQRNRQAGYAGVAFVLVLTGVPLLVATSFVINLYLGLVVIQIGLQDMWEKRKLTARGRNMLFYMGVLLSGFLAVQSAMLIVSMLFEKLMATVQGQSHERLANVFGELPQTVTRWQDGQLVSCPLAVVEAGDIVVVHAGEVIPVDGEIIAGHASVDQHALTGEAQPVERETGDKVFASTLVLMGEIRVQVAQANADTLAAQITTILNNTRSYQTRTGLRGIEIADNLVYVTTGLGLLVLPIWGVGAMLSVWAVPVGIMLMATTPLTLMAYLDMAARSKILVKDGRSLDLLSSIDTVIFDKTGTLTVEQPTVTAVYPYGELNDEEMLALAAAIEQHQSHPIATAIRAAAAAQALTLPKVDNTRIEVGYGLAVMVDDRYIQLGSQRYMSLSEVSIPADLQSLADERQTLGHSLVYLAMDGVLQGAIELQPTVRPEAQAVVDALHARGIELAMITGDQTAPAQALATTLGIDRVFANVLPEQKAELVQMLQADGRHVMFVGDGINDSIALKQAHVSVSIAGATTVATDTAQIVLMDGTLAQLDTLFELAERYERDLKSLYVLGVHVPAAHLAAILLLGWGLASTYVIGTLISLANLGVAFRPIWRQEQLETKAQPALTIDQPSQNSH